MPDDQAPSYTQRVRALMRARGNSEAFLEKLDAELRRKIAAEVRYPERIEHEVERVMEQVFWELLH